MQMQTMKLRELTIRYAIRKDHDGQPVIVGRALGRPSEAASALMTLLQDEPSEVLIVLCLTTKFRVIAYHEVGRGTLDTVLVNPREVFKAAVLANAATGRALIAASVNVQALLNRNRAELRLKGHRDRALQQEWNESDGAAFEFEILDTLEIGRRCAWPPPVVRLRPIGAATRSGVI
jgi:hypothetical protein